MSKKAHKKKVTSKTKQALIPKLRFPEFRDEPGWVEEDLSAIAENLDNKRIPITANIRVSGTIPYYGASGIVDYVNDFLFNEDLLCVSEDGANLVARTYPIAFSISGKTWVNNHAHVLRFKKRSTQKIVEDYLNSIDLGEFITGNAQPKINKAMLESIPIPLPCPAEIQRIADCLTSLDELITAHGQKLAALKAHKKGLMQTLFPRQPQTQPRLRFPEFRDGPEWEEKKLGKAADFYNGRAYKKEELLSHGKYRVLRVGNFFTNKNWYFSDLELDESKYCENGDLLYAWSASFGPHFWYGEKTIYHYHIWKVVEKDGIDKAFLAVALDHETQRMKNQAANGLGLLHITKSTIEGWKSWFPGLDEQRRIAGCLSSLDDLINSQSQKLETLKTHKKGLMQQLFPVESENCEVGSEKKHG